MALGIFYSSVADLIAFPFILKRPLVVFTRKILSLSVCRRLIKSEVLYSLKVFEESFMYIFPSDWFSVKQKPFSD